MYNPYRTGKFIYLRHPTEEDARGKWHEWFSDEETTKYLSDRFWPNSKEAQVEFYYSLLKNRNCIVLSVVKKIKDEHIGVVSLNKINWIHRYADISIVIGEKEYRTSPYATEAFALLIKIAFLQLNLLNLKSAYAKSNKGSEALHKLFKFKKVGNYQKLLCIDGKYDDLVLETLDRESWIKRNSLKFKKISKLKRDFNTTRESKPQMSEK